MPTVAAGNDDDVIASSVGATTTEALAEAVCAGLPLSLAVAVKLDIPLAVGTPEIVPVDDASVKPWGSFPEVIDHTYGVVPPVALRVFENGAPIVTAGRVEGTMANEVAVMTNCLAADAVWVGLLLSVTVAVKEKVPLTDGVPEIVPVVEVSATPEGRLPEVIDHE